MARSVGVTGMGIVSSIGESIPAFLKSLRDGKSGIAKMSRKRTPELSATISAEIRDMVFSDQVRSYRDVPEETLRRAERLGRRGPFTVQVTILSALEAWEWAGFFSSPPEPEKIGVIIAGQNATQNFQYELMPRFLEKPIYLSPRYGLEFLDSNYIGVLSEIFNIKGEGAVVGGASATGNVGIIHGYRMVGEGHADVCIVAGIVADPSPMDIQGFYNMGAMGGKAFYDKPEHACRPFDVQHEGFIYGQAGACLILESTEHAVRRGAAPAVEIAGVAVNLDGNSSSNPSLEGEVRAMHTAVESSGCSLENIDYVNTHGSSSPLGDKTEAEAIRQVFKSQAPRVWLNATKGLTGHCLYSAGVVEAVATVLQMHEGFLHPNKNLEEPVQKELRFCGREAIDHRITTALSNSFGFGGINTSIVLKRGDV
ncbi:MAG: beta-ketoacyl-ACP synthase [Chitinivibrionales bacterium]|nr:beta-ketoacyl-ACP synthase [Chitinivibrionales bacterium]MBD3357093.1 beta-ketoacyl-ACP synthase [Chitinivibrionales bacterium]